MKRPPCHSTLLLSPGRHRLAFKNINVAHAPTAYYTNGPWTTPQRPYASGSAFPFCFYFFLAFHYGCGSANHPVQSTGAGLIGVQED